MKTKNQPSLMERFAETHPGFQAEIKALAEKHGKTVEQVYGWWREYSDACRNFDQSAIMFEFLQWYKAKLEG